MAGSNGSFHRRRPRGAAPAVLALMSLLVTLGRAPAAAHADPAATPVGAQQCEATYRRGKEQATAGRLTEASQQFAACSDTACEPEIWEACVEANGQVHQLLPSVVPFAIDPDGVPRADVRVQVDGVSIAPHLAGVAIPVDPGPHRFSFTVGARVVATETILVEEGERSRPLFVPYPDPALATAPD